MEDQSFPVPNKSQRKAKIVNLIIQSSKRFQRRPPEKTSHANEHDPIKRQVKQSTSSKIMETNFLFLRVYINYSSEGSNSKRDLICYLCIPILEEI